MRALLLNSAQILQIRAQTGDRQATFRTSLYSPGLSYVRSTRDPVATDPSVNVHSKRPILPPALQEREPSRTTFSPAQIRWCGRATAMIGGLCSRR